MLRMICGLILLLPFVAQAAPDKIKFSFKNTELVKVIEEYSKLSGQKFIFDETVKGKATILNAEPVTLDEAFNQLSSALALNSFAISKQEDVFVVMPAERFKGTKSTS